MIAGVDEAGKGAVLGPLVVAAVAAPDWETVAVLGERDSKGLSPRRREAVCAEIVATLPFAVVEVPADAIDAARIRETMNGIVAGAHAEALRRLAASGARFVVAYLDACDVREGRYTATVGRQTRVRLHRGRKSPCRRPAGGRRGSLDRGEGPPRSSPPGPRRRARPARKRVSVRPGDLPLSRRLPRGRRPPASVRPSELAHGHRSSASPGADDPRLIRDDHLSPCPTMLVGMDWVTVALILLAVTAYAAVVFYVRRRIAAEEAAAEADEAMPEGEKTPRPKARAGSLNMSCSTARSSR